MAGKGHVRGPDELTQTVGFPDRRPTVSR